MRGGYGIAMISRLPQCLGLFCKRNFWVSLKKEPSVCRLLLQKRHTNLFGRPLLKKGSALCAWRHGEWQ